MTKGRRGLTAGLSTLVRADFLETSENCSTPRGELDWFSFYCPEVAIVHIAIIGMLLISGLNFHSYVLYRISVTIVPPILLVAPFAQPRLKIELLRSRVLYTSCLGRTVVVQQQWRGIPH